MKLRKSKSDRTFLIGFSTQALGTVALRRKSGPKDITWFREQMVWTEQPTAVAIGLDRGSVLRGFLWGRDRGNTRINFCQCDSRS